MACHRLGCLVKCWEGGVCDYILIFFLNLTIKQFVINCRAIDLSMK